MNKLTELKERKALLDSMIAHRLMSSFSDPKPDELIRLTIAVLDIEDQIVSCEKRQKRIQKVKSLFGF